MDDATTRVRSLQTRRQKKSAPRSELDLDADSRRVSFFRISQPAEAHTRARARREARRDRNPGLAVGARARGSRRAGRRRRWRLRPRTAARSARSPRARAVLCFRRSPPRRRRRPRWRRSWCSPRCFPTSRTTWCGRGRARRPPIPSGRCVPLDLPRTNGLESNLHHHHPSLQKRRRGRRDVARLFARRPRKPPVTVLKSKIIRTHPPRAPTLRTHRVA